MSRIREAFRWEYGLQRRHWLLLGAAAVGGADLYIANLTGSVPSWLAIAALCSPVVGVWAVLQASLDEQITLAVWSFIGWIGLGLVTLGLHSALASHLSFNQFHQTHPVGLAVMTTVTVAMILFGVTVMVGAANVAWQRRTGGDGGTTPEERVLTEREYADFDPIHDDTQPVTAPSGESPH